MVIFYSYVKLPEGNHHSPPLFPWGNSSLVLRTNEKIDEALMRISLVANDPVGRCGAWEQWMVFLFFFKGENGDFMVLMVI